MNKNTIATLTAMAFLLSLQSTRAGSATWNLNPTSSDWNTATNWTPATVPNGPADIASFDLSNLSTIAFSAPVEVSGITFGSDASAFNTTVPDTQTLTISGPGITNSSGTMQNFIGPQAAPNTSGGTIKLTNSASAGNLVTFMISGNSSNPGGTASLIFKGNSTAAASTIINNGNGPAGGGFFGGLTYFWNNSSAGSATITNNASLLTFGFGGMMYFYDDSTADGANFTNKGASTGGGGNVTFDDRSNAGHASFVNEGGTSGSSNGGGAAYFAGNSSADSASFAVYGSPARGGNGGILYFYGNSRAGMSTITASGGREKLAEGGSVVFSDNSHGDLAQIRLSGNATLDISLHFFPGPVLGSIDGDGIIYLGGNRLTIGANDLSTTLSALISDGGMSFGTGGSLKKIGTGDLMLTFANTYTGGTKIKRGRLTVSNNTGSATGTGPVEVDGGALAGSGTIAGSVNVGAGIGQSAVIAPGVNGGLGTLTIQAALRFRANATYDWGMNSDRSASDQIVAVGVTIDDGATISLSDGGSTVLPPGTSFTVIDNTAATAIAGAFANLTDGTAVTLGSNTYEIAYEGGDGNDLTLTVMP